MIVTGRRGDREARHRAYLDLVMVMLMVIAMVMQRDRVTDTQKS
ncbi:MAG: hypothetical protein WCJ30_01255 [Deltaproteobacteria bacterium]